MVVVFNWVGMLDLGKDRFSRYLNTHYTKQYKHSLEIQHIF